MEMMMWTHHTVIVRRKIGLHVDTGDFQHLWIILVRVFEAVERAVSKTTGSGYFEAIEREYPKPPDQTGQSIRGYRTRESKTTGSNGSEYSRLSNERIQNHRIKRARVFEAIERENPKPPDQTGQSIRGYRTCSVQDHRIKALRGYHKKISKTTGSEYSRLSNVQCPKPPDQTDQSIRGYRTCSVQDHRIRVFEAIELAVSETTGSEYLRLSNVQCPRPSEGSRFRDLRRVNRCGMGRL
ncbi:hypothetical protein FIBSPDRAFT_886608 [Athelia psychrophila]|uniref:Uncharacterized protein n=1 Tax=Athelia psychrophila TaxID=1759441 RepID=A0A166QNQ8_9AGAM|nr:hypothetical protein FIBSPDRAFT_886608 [Fibularhizoctonia sp. CBS 109695]